MRKRNFRKMFALDYTSNNSRTYWLTYNVTIGLPLLVTLAK